MNDKTNLLRDTFLEAMRLHGTDTTRRMYFTEYSVNLPEDISYCVAIPQGSKGEYVSIIPEIKAIYFFHHGAYEDIPEARKRLLSYAEENKLKLTGVFRNIYLSKLKLLFSNTFLSFFDKKVLTNGKYYVIIPLKNKKTINKNHKENLSCMKKPLLIS